MLRCPLFNMRVGPSPGVRFVWAGPDSPGILDTIYDFLLNEATFPKAMEFA